MKWLIAKLILYPLVYRNMRLREKGLLPDKWYWADIKLSSWGYLYRRDNELGKLFRTGNVSGGLDRSAL